MAHTPRLTELARLLAVSLSTSFVSASTRFASHPHSLLSYRIPLYLRAHFRTKTQHLQSSIMSDDWDSATTIGAKSHGGGARATVARTQSELNAARRSGAVVATEKKVCRNRAPG